MQFRIVTSAEEYERTLVPRVPHQVQRFRSMAHPCASTAQWSLETNVQSSTDTGC